MHWVNEHLHYYHAERKRRYQLLNISGGPGIGDSFLNPVCIQTPSAISKLFFENVKFLKICLSMLKFKEITKEEKILKNWSH
jgi:hypothetical protein